MRAGELKQRVTLKKPVKSRGDWSELVTTYEDVATVWAAIEWGSGRRYFEAKQLNAEVQGVIRIWYRSDVKPYWRIGYGSRTFQIISISNYREEDVELHIQVKEAQD
jgi:SPP1 family predicted phage head-tail adaptor